MMRSIQKHGEVCEEQTPRIQTTQKIAKIQRIQSVLLLSTVSKSWKHLEDSEGGRYGTNSDKFRRNSEK